MRDLFASNQQFERLPMEDADVSILRGLDTHASYEIILKKLLRDSKWQQREMNFYGKKVLQPRLTAWYGDSGKSYLYSGIKNVPLPWTDLLRELCRNVEGCTSARFNSVLLNLYRNQNDSMGFHSDDEKELGDEPVIASLSFGATRTFLFKHKHKDRPLIKLPLEEGTVLLMRGPTQRNWQHAINRETRPCGPRVNLTFRQIFTAAELDVLRAEEYARRRA